MRFFIYCLLMIVSDNIIKTEPFIATFLMILSVVVLLKLEKGVLK